MRWITLYLLAISGLLLLVQQVSSTAKFELELTNFVNINGRDNEGNCCSGFRKSTDGLCSEKCNTKFRVCLNVYQAVIDYKSPCVFGEIFTPVLGSGSEIDFTAVNPVQFSLATWQITFSLIIEAWHDNNGTNSYAGPVLVQRLMTQGELDVNENWSSDSQDSDHSSLSYRYRVVCKEHYYGKNCKDYCRARDDDLGHYDCNAQGRKVCLEGWLPGQDGYCLTPICSQGCKEGQGECVAPNECRCLLGWTGEKCDECKKYPGCKYGTCNKAWECNCNEGWGGLFCNQDLNYCTNHKPCKNGATCFNTMPGSYSCQCPPGFTGTNCEITNHTCATDPCQNGGTCLDTGNGQFVCQCPTGFAGAYCHVSGKTCSDRPCLNGASCVDTHSGFKCLCPTGYEGETCQTQSNECESNPCFNGGSCVDEELGFRCVCPTGFAGPQCQENINDCSHKPCYNNGICIDGINSFTCKCQSGFVGDFCEMKTNFCNNSPCANGGTCYNSSNDFKCLCRSEWGGKYCTEPRNRVSPCESNPCQNGGVCSDAYELSSGYRCLCPSGLIGPQCNVKTTSSSYTNPEALPVQMSKSQIILICVVSAAVPVVAIASASLILCLKRRRRQEGDRQDELVRRQNEQNIIHNAVNNKGLESHMIINSLDYPVKPINTDMQYNQLPGVHYPASKPQCDSKLQQQQQQPHQQYYLGKKAIENAYEVVKTRSTKTLNTDSSRLSLASRLEKDLEVSCPRRPNDDASSYCKTPDPFSQSTYSQHTLNSCGSREDGGPSNVIIHPPDMIHNSSSNTISSSSSGCGGASTCTTPSSIYVIEEHYDDSYLATQV